jgi:hypothetical protein
MPILLPLNEIPWKLFGVMAYGVGEVNRLLVDEQLLEGECHGALSAKKVERSE